METKLDKMATNAYIIPPKRGVSCWVKTTDKKCFLNTLLASII